MPVTITSFVPRAVTPPPVPAPAVCPLCDGLRVVQIPQHLWPRGVISPVEACVCLRAEMLAEELDAACPGLSRVEPHTESPLNQLLGTSAVIRGTVWDFHRHLSKILRDDKDARVRTRTVTDQDLVDCQFTMGRREGDLPADLILPPGLLVLQLGCTHGKHRYLPGVVGQACARRAHAGRATWIVDARQVQAGHPAWSDQLARVLGTGSWSVVDLDPQPQPDTGSAAQGQGPDPAHAARHAAQPARTEEDEIDPEILEMAIRNGWTYNAQSNGGIRTLCQKHPESGLDLSIWRVREGVLKGKLRYKCQLTRCSAGGDPARLPAAAKIRS